MTVSTVIIELLVVVAVHAAVAWSLHAWGRWVAERQSGTGWRYAAVMPVGGFWLAMIGIVVSIFLLLITWRKVDHGDAADRATSLAEGVAMSLNLTATFAALSGALYVASLVAFAVGTLRRPR